MKSPVKILLADNSVTMHRAVRLALKKEPYELMLTDNGSDALRICQEHRPAVLIADLDLTGITGGELIKKVSQTLQTKSILLCGSFHQVEEKHLEKIPADARLWKPFESHVLVTLLRTLIQSESSPSAPQADPTQAISLDQNREQTQQILSPSTSPQPKKVLPKTNTTSVEETLPYIAPQATKAPEAPRVSSTNEETRPLLETNMKDKVLSAAEIKENLWSPDFDSFRGEIKTEKLNSPINEAQQSENEKEAEDYYVVDRTVEKQEIEKEPASSAGLTSFESSGQSPNIESLSIYNELNEEQKNEIKSMVRSEIDSALNTWFKDRLQERLDEIVNMIEDESKS